jgi:molecular chaperone GrpE
MKEAVPQQALVKAPHFRMHTLSRQFVNHQRQPISIIGCQQRCFFSKKEDKNKQATTDKTAETADQTTATDANAKPEDSKKQATAANNGKKEETTTSSSDEDVADTLTKEDIKKIKQLIADQDKEIDTLKGENKKLKERLMYEMAENDNTVKRYKKELDSTKEFAISKFAKDLLEVKDSLELAMNHVKKSNISEVTDVEQLKGHIENISKGLEMTNTVMDNILKRFGVIQFDPTGEKFDPNIHEAVFVMPDPSKDNNTVGNVMQSGWKIGDRVLRAAKVGIVKNS